MSTENKSSIIADIYKSRNIILEQMELMKYNIVENMDFSVHEVNTMYKNKQLDMLLEKKVESTDEDNKDNGEDVINNNKEITTKVYIHYYLTKTLRPANIMEIVEELFNVEEILSKRDTLYIIIKDEPNESLINYIKQLWEEDGIFIILQSLKRLQFNILNHQLVPKHRIIESPKERESIKKKYNIMDNSQLPEISRFDPVSQVIGARPGDIVEIQRQSKTAINAIYYRICI